MGVSAQGEDRSSYQAILPWKGLDFGIAKATEGTTWSDPTFAANWANLHAAGIPRGAYHFLHPSLDPVAQAQFFLRAVEAHGLAPGDMLIIDAEIMTGTAGELLMTPRAARRSHLLTAGPNGRAFPLARMRGKHEIALTASLSVGAAALAFLSHVGAAYPHNPVLVYTDLAVGSVLGGCTGWDLFIAFYASSAPPSVAPWKTWRFWQWSAGGGIGGSDRDAFNGSPAQLRAWIDSFKPKPSPPSPPPVTEDPDMPSLLPGTHQVTTVTAAPGAYLKAVAFASDWSLAGTHDPVLRVAAHSVARGWDIQSFTLPKNGRKEVTFTQPDVDEVSVQRVAGNAGDSVNVGYATA